LGTGFDVPVPGDYDGDGKADPAVYTATSGDWEILQSASNHRARRTINSRPISIPAPGDYDGDGLMDIGLFFAPGNSWFILKSSTGDSDIVTRSWGISTDVPVFKRP
jgi:hypothetical protein